MRRSRPWLLIAFALLTFTLHAQQQPALSERVEVRLLEVDVVVTDAAGKPVHGLSPSDFELIENGKPQPITNLTEYNDTTAGAAPATAQQQPAAAVAPSRPAPRTLVLLLDSIQLRGKSRADFFNELRLIVDATIRTGDRVQMLTWAGGAFRPTLDLTPDREAIRAALDASEKNAPVAPARGISIESREAMLRTRDEISQQSAGMRKAPIVPFNPEDLDLEKRALANEELAQMRAKTASMQRIVSSLANPSGRTIVIYASEQFPRIAGKRAFLGTRSGGVPTFNEPAFDTRELIQSVVAAANANGISFYAVLPRTPSAAGEFRTSDEEAVLFARVDDPTRGATGTDASTDQLLLQNELEGLRQLASETGGTVGIGPGGMKDVARQIASDLGSYYSLGWRGQSDGTDRERRVSVRTKNRSWSVRTRSALVEKSDRTRAEDLLVAQLFERGSAGELEVDVQVKPPKRSRGDLATIPIELAIPVDQLEFVETTGERAATFTVLIVAGARPGETTRITRDTRRLNAGDKQTKDGLVRYTTGVVSDLKGSAVAVGVFDETSGQVGIRTIELLDGTATVTPPPPSAIANAAWREAFEKSLRQKKPLVVFFRPSRCPKCDELDGSTLSHPAIASRRNAVVFSTVSWPPSRKPPAVWTSAEPGIGVFDPAGTLRGSWSGVPDTMKLGRILDGAAAAWPNFQRAVALARSGGRWAGANENAVGLLKLGFPSEARMLLEETSSNGDAQQRQRAVVALAALDAREGHVEEARVALAKVRAEPASAEVAAEAAFNLGVLDRYVGADRESVESFRAAITLGGATSPVGRAAAAELAGVSGTIRIVPFSQQVISGIQTVRTIVSSAAIARVVFTLDGNDSVTVAAPPFSTPMQFGRLPEAHRVRVVGYDTAGNEVGRDEMAVNGTSNVFWLRVTDPAGGSAHGEVTVTLELRAPADHVVKSVALSWNDKPLSTLVRAPWRGNVRIPQEVGVLRATATLDDGRVAEDAVLLNGTGYAERMDVQLVQLPMTITPRASVAPAEIVVTEGETKRAVESVVSGSDAPLTVGVLIDSSSSMQMHLDEVQEAVLRFFDTALGTSDQAFLISFESTAKLETPRTGDRGRLRTALLKLLPNGYTALHDAIVLGLLQLEGTEGRRALLVFTDGDDTSSRYSAADVVELARRSNIPIYLIAPKLEGSSRDVVKAARASGGQVHEVSNVSRLTAIYDAIAEALRAQMLVTIRTSTAAKQNDWREIKVELTKKDVEVRAPAGYYAPR